MAKTVQKDGRRYSINSGGITTLRRDYLVALDGIMGADGEMDSFPGVPTIGSIHPIYTYLEASSYDVEEGIGTEKETIKVTVNYAPRTFEVSDPTDPKSPTVQVEEWGWDNSTDEIELTVDQDGKSVVNSAGDPFDTVPKVSVPAPTFTKVMKFATRQTGWNVAVGCVNQNQLTIGGINFPTATLLISIAEKRIIGDEKWKYQYTVQLKYKKNEVRLAGADNATNIGWDVAVVDTGMRELVTTGSGDSAKTSKRIIRVIDKETGKSCEITSPVLLDGKGKQLPENGKPYAFRFKAYPRATIPNWCYSEPTATEEGLKK